MLKKIFSDSILDNSALMFLGTLPLFALGCARLTVPYWCFIIIGGISILMFVIRLIMLLAMKKSPVSSPKWNSTVKWILGFPLPLLVMTGIGQLALPEHISNSEYILPAVIFVTCLIPAFLKTPKNA